MPSKKTYTNVAPQQQVAPPNQPIAPIVPNAGAQQQQQQSAPPQINPSTAEEQRVALYETLKEATADAKQAPPSNAKIPAQAALSHVIDDKRTKKRYDKLVKSQSELAQERQRALDTLEKLTAAPPPAPGAKVTPVDPKAAPSAQTFKQAENLVTTRKKAVDAAKKKVEQVKVDEKKSLKKAAENTSDADALAAEYDETLAEQDPGRATVKYAQFRAATDKMSSAERQELHQLRKTFLSAEKDHSTAVKKQGELTKRITDLEAMKGKINQGTALTRVEKDFLTLKENKVAGVPGLLAGNLRSPSTWDINLTAANWNPTAADVEAGIQAVTAEKTALESTLPTLKTAMDTARTAAEAARDKVRDTATKAQEKKEENAQKKIEAAQQEYATKEAEYLAAHASDPALQSMGLLKADLALLRADIKAVKTEQIAQQLQTLETINEYLEKDEQDKVVRTTSLNTDEEKILTAIRTCKTELDQGRAKLKVLKDKVESVKVTAEAFEEKNTPEPGRSRPAGHLGVNFLSAAVASAPLLGDPQYRTIKAELAETRKEAEKEIAAIEKDMLAFEEQVGELIARANETGATWLHIPRLAAFETADGDKSRVHYRTPVDIRDKTNDAEVRVSPSDRYKVMKIKNPDGSSLIQASANPFYLWLGAESRRELLKDFLMQCLIDGKVKTDANGKKVLTMKQIPDDNYRADLIELAALWGIDKVDGLVMKFADPNHEAALRADAKEWIAKDRQNFVEQVKKDGKVIEQIEIAPGQLQSQEQANIEAHKRSMMDKSASITEAREYFAKQNQPNAGLTIGPAHTAVDPNAALSMGAANSPAQPTTSPLLMGSGGFAGQGNGAQAFPNVPSQQPQQQPLVVSVTHHI